MHLCLTYRNVTCNTVSSYLAPFPFLAFTIYFYHSIDFIEAVLLHQMNVEALKKEIIRKCEELLPRDVRDNKVMGQFGANHILSGICY